MKRLLVIALIISVFVSCTNTSQELYDKFQNPEVTSQLFVRWWWNGNKLTKEEISRELDIMKQAGIGGVEINPISFPKAEDPTNTPEIEWLSEEWLDMLEYALNEAKARGIICDMIIGSGWPFGGEFLPREEQTQMTTIESIPVKGGKFRLSISEVLDSVEPKLHSGYDDKKKDLLALWLVSQNISDIAQAQEIVFDHSQEYIDIDIPQGEYVLYPIVRLTGFMSVINGAKGARGPVMNHYCDKATEHYVYRLINALKVRLGANVSDYIRAFFVDSIELEGANWCDDMIEQFNARRGYDISPYLPFVLPKVGEMGNAVVDVNASVPTDSLLKLINLVRYDFELTKTELFKERFSDVVKKACHSVGVKFRMQAYGRGFYPVESSMELDIPETETWHNLTIGVNMKEFGTPGAFFYNGANTEFSRQGRAYTMSNKFVSSGAHLAGKSIISCEEITNTEMLFNASLNQIKLIGDQSNLSGVTHSILHGFNYTPADAPFPGWIQYGTYLNERNPFWSFFPQWAEYKARLSSLFMSSEMKAEIAILHPIVDLWKKYGSQRDPFPMIVYPDYAHNLWEAIHQNGSACDYITESVIKKSNCKKGGIKYGSRSYSTLILMNIESLEVETAEQIETFVKGGGKVISIATTPSNATGFVDYDSNSEKVAEIIANIKSMYPSKFIEIDAPTKPLSEWYANLARNESLPKYMSFDKPNVFVSQIPYQYKDIDIFFVCNSNSTQSYPLSMKFDLKGRNLWMWNPESGDRYLMRTFDDGKLDITIKPSQSFVFVVDKNSEGEYYTEVQMPNVENAQPLQADWTIKMNHVNGAEEVLTISKLFDLSKVDKYKNFGGILTYTTTINGAVKFIDFGFVNGVSELYVNGEKVDDIWYGKHLYNISNISNLSQQSNEIKLVIYTTVGNYMKDLDSPVSKSWMGVQPYYPCGIVGDVFIY